MQSETALRFPALAMQLSNVVKTLVLRAMNVPKRTASTMALTLDGREHVTAMTLAKRCAGGLFRRVPVSGNGQTPFPAIDEAFKKGCNHFVISTGSPYRLHHFHIRALSADVTSLVRHGRYGGAFGLPRYVASGRSAHHGKFHTKPD